jgi:hypothetical protein
MESMALVNCAGSTSVLFKNSIFVGNGLSAQLGSACRVTANSLVVGASDPVAGQIKQEPIFENAPNQDYRLKPKSAANQQSVIDEALEVNAATEPFTDHDFAGNKRPQGDGHDIGAHEVELRRLVLVTLLFAPGDEGDAVAPG